MARNAQRLIDMAADILFTNATQRSTGLKNLLYDAPIPSAQRPLLMALVNGTYKEKDQLLACAQEDGFLDSLPPHLQLDHHENNDLISFQIQVVLYECLLGSRRVRGTSEIVQLVKDRKTSLQKTLAARRKRGAANSFVPLEKRVQMPRYVRVNLLKLTEQEAHQHMQSYGYQHVDSDLTPSLLRKHGIPTNNNFTKYLEPMTYMTDRYIPSLFCLPPNTSLHGDEQVERGGFILQDRSSCLTALALNPPPHAHCLDTCSSPGNKTLQLAALMMQQQQQQHKRLKENDVFDQMSGSITALERSPNRFRTLVQRIRTHGAAELITPLERDFMTVDTSAKEFAQITHVLIDPSCSGSGLVSTYGGGAGRAPTEADEYDPTTGRQGNASDTVTALAREQQALILHAMSLPNAQVICYSTCSIHCAENEDVVLAVLAQRPDWTLVPALSIWPHRGLDLPAYQHIKDLVCRASLEEDGTNGFFVARFERKDALVDLEEKESATAEDSVTYKRVRKAAKKILKKATDRTMKYKLLRKAVKAKLKLSLDKKQLRRIMDGLISKDPNTFCRIGKQWQLVAKSTKNKPLIGND